MPGSTATSRCWPPSLKARPERIRCACSSQHEAVNDWLGDSPLLVTYCPRCNSAAVFERNAWERSRCSSARPARCALRTASSSTRRRSPGGSNRPARPSRASSRGYGCDLPRRRHHLLGAISFSATLTGPSFPWSSGLRRRLWSSTRTSTLTSASRPRPPVSLTRACRLRARVLGLVERKTTRSRCRSLSSSSSGQSTQQVGGAPVALLWQRGTVVSRSAAPTSRRDGKWGQPVAFDTRSWRAGPLTISSGESGAFVGRADRLDLEHHGRGGERATFGQPPERLPAHQQFLVVLVGVPAGDGGIRG